MNIFNGFECSGVNAELKFTAVKFPQIPVFICFPVASTKRCLTEFYQSSSADQTIPYIWYPVKSCWNSTRKEGSKTAAQMSSQGIIR